MSTLTPNCTYYINGVKICEKIIPDGTVCKDISKARNAGFTSGSYYKAQKKLNSLSYITVHNTADLANVDDDAEQYTRATYNENMGAARVHFYVDDNGAWQNLKAGIGISANDGEAEVGWHAGDGVARDGGNYTSIGIEVIMNESSEHDNKAKDNSARLCAYLLYINNLGINRLVTHTYWINKKLGKSYIDIDEQCSKTVTGYKLCPVYILGGYNNTNAKNNWKAYKNLVNKYLEELKNKKDEDDDVVRYNKASDIPDSYWRAYCNELVEKGYLKGDENGNLDITIDMLRVIKILSRMK